MGSESFTDGTLRTVSKGCLVTRALHELWVNEEGRRDGGWVLERELNLWQRARGQSEDERCVGGIGWSSLLSEQILGARHCHVGSIWRTGSFGWAEQSCWPSLCPGAQVPLAPPEASPQGLRPLPTPPCQSPTAPSHPSPPTPMGLLAPAPCSVCLRHGVQNQTKKSQYIQFLKNQNVKTFKRGVVVYRGFPGGSDGEESACNAGDPGLIPGLERSPGEGNGNPLQYSCLENSTDRGAWRATVLGVPKSRTEWLTQAAPEGLQTVISAPVQAAWVPVVQ